jgi:phosphate acetyltransferase
MAFIDRIKIKARGDLKRIVLPEGAEPRTVNAAVQIAAEGLAKPILLGDPAVIKDTAGGSDLNGIDIINPASGKESARYAGALLALRKDKGMTPEKAAELVYNPMYYGVMMVKMSDADGLVSGAVHSTGDMLVPALQIIKTKPGVKKVSSCFIMETITHEFGENGLFIFADCAVLPNPAADELASVAIAAADSARNLAGMEPRIAMLSFSTKGSAEHELVDKVREATAIAKQAAPDLLLDGELQLDAAIASAVGQLKAPGSPVAGRANTLVFPDLQSANIGYKLVQWLGKSEAYGPILQGIAKPCNDLSRGCSVGDIVALVAITAVQAQEAKSYEDTNHYRRIFFH